MMMTENQRRWWFATHPEFSRQSNANKRRSADADNKRERKFIPEQVDDYVNKALMYETGPVAELLKSVKRHFGSEGDSVMSATRLAQADDGPIPLPSEGEEDIDTREAGFWDAVLHGMTDTFSDWEDWFGIAIGPTAPSRRLGREMTRAGRPRPSPYHDAHHIVPTSDGRFPEAKEARKILEGFGIDLYNDANGVWLPRKRGIVTSAYHPAIHNGDYYREVLRRLREAGTREKVIGTLEQIGKELEKGLFPKIGGAP